MTRRAVLFLPLAAITLIAALFAYRQGYIAANLTETDVINQYAAQYVAEHQGLYADCTANPGNPPVWLVITCAPDDGMAITYLVDKGGRPVPHQPDDDLQS